MSGPVYCVPIGQAGERAQRASGCSESGCSGQVGAVGPAGAAGERAGLLVRSALGFNGEYIAHEAHAKQLSLGYAACFVLGPLLHLPSKIQVAKPRCNNATTGGIYKIILATPTQICTPTKAIIICNDRALTTTQFGDRSGCCLQYDSTHLCTGYSLKTYKPAPPAQGLKLIKFFFNFFHALF